MRYGHGIYAKFCYRKVTSIGSHGYFVSSPPIIHSIHCDWCMYVVLIAKRKKKTRKSKFIYVKMGPANDNSPSFSRQHESVCRYEPSHSSNTSFLQCKLTSQTLPILPHDQICRYRSFRHFPHFAKTSQVGRYESHQS